MALARVSTCDLAMPVCVDLGHSILHLSGIIFG